MLKIFSIVILFFCFTSFQTVLAQTAKAVEESTPEIVSIDRANLYLQKCLNTFPEKFTPKAHKRFCHCSAANVRLNITNSELNSLERKLITEAGNEVFEKYIQQVISPCMEIAVEDIAYVGCLEERGHSPYIINILDYCRCTGQQMAKFVKYKGASSIIINMTNNPQFYKDPLKTLLTTNQYNIAYYQAYKACRPFGLEKKNRI